MGSIGRWTAVAVPIIWVAIGVCLVVDGSAVNLAVVEREGDFIERVGRGLFATEDSLRIRA